jgi:hypothetical protein
MEGTSGHHEPSLSRGAVTVALAASPMRDRNAKALQDTRWNDEAATGVSEARSRRAPWKQNVHVAFVVDPPKRIFGVVKHRVPQMPRGALDAAGYPGNASCRQGLGPREVRFHVEIQVADVGRTHRVL